MDISKAYDRVSWSFLESIMLKMGFEPRWVKWMIMCVNSVEYNVLMNHEEVGPIIPERGLRQGDPLSPYLYILCAEGLSSLIRSAERRGLIHGVKICRGAPVISHLLFADDSFPFFQANEREVSVMKHLLFVDESATGQAINYQKSEIQFSKNVPPNTRDFILNTLEVRESLGSGNYLGLPSFIG